MKDNKEHYYIDIDGAIIKHNKLYPDDIINRSMLTKELNITYQSMMNYQFKNSPKVIGILDKISKRLKIPTEELIKIKTDNEEIK